MYPQAIMNKKGSGEPLLNLFQKDAQKGVFCILGIWRNLGNNFGF